MLSDAYTQMGREERQALLHEGSGSAVMSAYVEIIFDNSDDRFPTGKEELILRRTIGLKKDEYSLDRKAATKNDVMNLLESAGFSRSNPYYIVPQGRVTTLTNMKDPERLNLLKEVAGTQVYEARRSESLKIMVETNNKRAKIDELMDYIKDRLRELEEEKEELRGYQDKDKDRRCLEYAYYAKEQEAVTAAIDELETARSDGLENTDESRQQFMQGEKAISDMEAEIKQLTREIDLLKLERRQLEEDRRDVSRSQAKLELNVKNLSDGLSVSEQARNNQQQELKSVKELIVKKEAELANVLPKYKEQKAKEADVKGNLDKADGERTRLYNKQGRSSLYKNKAERDKALRKEIEDVSGKLGEQKANRIHANEEVEHVQSQIKGLESEIAGLRERFDGWGDNRRDLAEEVSTAKDALTKLHEERKLLRREDDKLESLMADARQEAERAERELSSTMDVLTSRGLATVRRLKRQHNIEGAYGTLAELFDVNETYRTAAEQTAGNSLFHYVVDTEETAEKLMTALYNQQGGRVTFMPLNRLNPRSIKLPKAMDAQGLLSKLTYDKKFDKAMNQVFGKTVVCPSLAVASQYARSHGCNAITPDGDTANKKGAMTGGYIDSRKSRLQAVRSVNKWRDEFETLKARSDEIRKEAEEIDQQITAAMGEQHKKEQKLQQLDDKFEPERAELSGKNLQLEKMRTQLENEIKRKETMDRLFKEYDETKVGLEKELASDYKSSLTAAEVSQLEQLNSAIQDLQKEWNEVSKARRTLEAQKQSLEIELRDNLRLKLDQLTSQEIDSSSSGGSGNLKLAQRDLKRVRKEVAANDAKLEENDTKTEEAEEKVSTLQKEKAEVVKANQALAQDIEKQQKRMEKSVAKKALLTASALETSKNIRDLGVLPEEAFEKYINKNPKDVCFKT